jgi:PP-loop superfamily ATP-utilizing enzyme
LHGDDLVTAVQRRDEVVAAVRGAGYRYVTLDLEGFRSGNLNLALSGAPRGAGVASGAGTSAP